jgi:hypothetical protein
VVDPIGVSRALGLADGDAFNTLVEAVRGQDARSALELVARLASEGADLRRFVAECVGFFRGVFLAHYAPNLAEIADEPAEVLNSWKQASASLPSADVLRAVDIMGDALIKLREGREERLMLELAMIRLTRPETAFDAGAIQSRLERLERRLVSQPVAAPSGMPHSHLPATPPGERAVEDEPPSLRVVPAPPEVAAEEPVGDEPDTPVTPPGAAEAVFETSMGIAQAAAPLVAEDAAPAPRSKVSPTMAQFEQIWPALFAGLRDLLGSRRWALFRETEPGAVEGSTLVVAVKHDFHLKALKDDTAVAMIVSTRAGDLLGGDVRVVFRGPGESGGGAAPIADTAVEEDLSSIEFQPDRLIEAPPDLTDPFKLVTEELGGTVVDEYEVESSDD